MGTEKCVCVYERERERERNREGGETVKERPRVCDSWMHRILELGEPLTLFKFN